MVYFPKPRPRRETEWRTTQSPTPTVMPNSSVPRPSERVRVMPGMSPDTVLVTGYWADGTPAARMEIPRRWLTHEWVTWLEGRIAKEEGATAPQLKLLG